MIITTHQEAVVFPPFTLTLGFETQDEVDKFLSILDKVTPEEQVIGGCDIKANIVDNITFV